MLLCTPKHTSTVLWQPKSKHRPPDAHFPNVSTLQGKQDAWSHAHSKTHEASKHANASELAACKAQEHYGNLTESQKNAENARRRHQEVRAQCIHGSIFSCVIHVSLTAVHSSK